MDVKKIVFLHPSILQTDGSKFRLQLQILNNFGSATLTINIQELAKRWMGKISDIKKSISAPPAPQHCFKCHYYWSFFYNKLLLNWRGCRASTSLDQGSCPARCTTRGSGLSPASMMIRVLGRTSPTHIIVLSMLKFTDFIYLIPSSFFPRSGFFRFNADWGKFSIKKIHVAKKLGFHVEQSLRSTCSTLYRPACHAAKLLMCAFLLQVLSTRAGTGQQPVLCRQQHSLYELRY